MLDTTADGTNLLDPAHCSHPARFERYDGPFLDENDEPIGVHVSCLCCGASRTKLVEASS